MKSKANISLIIDLLGILARILAGALLLVLYVGLRAKIDNWFIHLLSVFFLIGLGLTAVVLGFWRLYSILKVRRRENGKAN